MVYLYADYYVGNSNGIRCEYELVRRLNAQGIPARIVCKRKIPHIELKNNPVPDVYKNLVFINKKPKLSDKDIAIYTEENQNNPLNAQKVVRWLLNRACLNGELSCYKKNELLLSYSYLVSDKLPQLFIMLNEVELLEKLRNRAKKQNNSVCIYFGKMYYNRSLQKTDILDKLVSQYKHIHVITRNIPAAREDALAMIAASELFVSFDGLTNLNYEATLLGTPALIVDDYYGIKEKKYNVDTSGFAFSMEEITDAQENIERVWESYVYYFNHSEENIAKQFKKIEKRLNAIQSDANAQQENRAINEQIMEEDRELFKKKLKEEKITNVFSLSDIPIEFKEVLSKNAAVKKQLVKPKNYKKIIIDNIKKRIKSALTAFDLYDRVKTWKDNAYFAPAEKHSIMQRLYVTLANTFSSR